jgi:hypothetical protein
MKTAHLEIGGNRMFDVNENARVVLGNLVHEDWTRAFDQGHGAMVRYRQDRVLQNCTDEVAFRCRFDRRTQHRGPEIGVAPVRYNDQARKKRLLFLLALQCSAHPNNLTSRGAVLDEICHRPLDNMHTWRPTCGRPKAKRNKHSTGASHGRRAPQIHYEAPMVEGSPLVSPGVRNLDDFACVAHAIALDLGCVDVFENRLEAEFFESENTAWLHEFTDDAVRFMKRALE